MAFTRVVLAGGGEVSDPPLVLAASARHCGFARTGGLDTDGLQQEPLRRRQLLPCGPLRGDPGAELFALDDEFTCPGGEGAAGAGVGEGEPVTALPGHVPPLRGPPGVDGVQRFHALLRQLSGVGEASLRAAFPRVLRAVARWFLAHTPIGKPSPPQTAVASGRKCPCVSAYDRATASPASHALACTDHTMPSASSSATRPA